MSASQGKVAVSGSDGRDHRVWTHRAGAGAVCVLITLLSIGGVALASSGTRGPRGPRGPRGRQGPTGPAKGPDQFLVSSASVTIPAGTFSSAVASCPSGVATGGGGYFASNSQTTPLAESGPSGTGWYASGFNGTSSAATLTTYAVCDPTAGLFTAIRARDARARAASADTDPDEDDPVDTNDRDGDPDDVAVLPGPPGPRGPRGPQGPAGQGPPPAVVQSATVAIAPNAVGQATVSCGHAATGGGALLANPLSTSDRLLGSGPTSTVSGASTSGWSAAAFNSSSSSRQLTVYALCDPPRASSAVRHSTLRGPRGPRGPRGFQGPPGPSLITLIEDVPAQVTIPAGATGEATATCDIGTASGGGAYFAVPAEPGSGILQSNPVGAGNGQPASGWHAAAYNGTSAPVTLTVLAACLAYVPPGT